MNSHIIPIILTYNEEVNIGRCLSGLKNFKTVLVIDSGSEDSTLDICREFGNTVIIKHSFKSFADQWNFALKLDIVKDSWVLAMDADYFVSDLFEEEIRGLIKSGTATAYRCSFDYAINGVVLKCGVYPGVVCLFYNRDVLYYQDGHCMRLHHKGVLGEVRSKIIHDDRKSPSRFIINQIKYSEQEYLHRYDKSRRKYFLVRYIIPVSPILVFLYLYIFKQGFLDGRRGLLYIFQRILFECFIIQRHLTLICFGRNN